VTRTPKRPVKKSRHLSPSLGLPPEATILDFIASSPGKVGKREIARAFDLKGKAKIGLKSLLKDLEGRGALKQKGKKTDSASVLPPVSVLEVVGIDEDGHAFAEPTEWNVDVAGPLPVILVKHEHKSGQAAPGIGDRILARIEATPHATRYVYQARVMRPLSRDALRVVGIYRAGPGNAGRIVPSGKKDRYDYHVPHGENANAQDGELVSAEVTKPAARGLPQARVRLRLGNASDPRNTSLIAIHTHGIPDQLPQSVLDEVATLRPFVVKGREDLRQVPLLTIDPADARDHDDAVWAAADDNPQNSGGHIVIVAIADVAVYVHPQSALDREARRRGNSTYFPDRVVPMLPERISNDLCSLREAEDRPALACHMVFDRHGKKRSHRFTRAVIRSAAKLAYEEAQAAIDGKGNARTMALLEPALRPLWAAYKTLCIARDKRGPLELDLPEKKIILDSKGNVDKVVVPKRLDAHRLIEEFMIQANVAAAEELNKQRTPLLFRVHEEPSQDKVRSLSDFLKTVNIPFALGQVLRSRHFNHILTQARGTDHETLVHQVVLRSQAQAQYRADNAGHFGLSLANYAHFTSPIRRYADLIVHRALITACKLGGDGLSGEDIAKLAETAELISAAERRSMIAERETVDRLVAAHLSTRIGAEFKARIGGVVGAGLFVTLEETGADGFVPVSTLGRSFFVLDDVRHALVSRETGETFQMGDTVDVRLAEVAPVKGGLKFDMVSDGKKGAKPPQAGRRRVKKPFRGRR
jgi:ribonuclease R